MDQDKRMTIVAEIEHWKRSKLLPEQYCEFLLNLYADKREEPEKSMMGISTAAVRNSSGKWWAALFAIIGIIAFVGIHFTSFPFGMQTGIAAAGTALLYMLGAVWRVKQPAASYLCFGVGSVLLLLAGLYLLEAKGMTGGLPVLFYVALCSMIWIATGIAARLPVFHLAGWLALFLIYGIVLRHNIKDMDWIGLELSWVPVSLVLVWLGWLFHHVNKQIAAMLLVVGLLGWFGAEIYGLVWTELDSGRLQLLLAIKLGIGCSLLFAMRKKWVEWVV